MPVRGFRYLHVFLMTLLLAACANPLAQAPTPTSAPELPTARVATPAPEPTARPAATPVPAATAVVADRQTPRFEQADCAFDEPRNVDLECGYLVVPENRANPNSRTIRLHVAVFRSDARNPAPDPIVYLDGGPGGNPLETLQFSFDRWYRPLLERGDLIIFDQRGTGYSEPALDCPEETELSFEVLDQILSIQEGERRFIEAMRACHERLAREEEVDFTAYNSVASAADLNDLRTVLGYEEWNVWGISYGTRLALTLMRTFPEGIRSVVLDSTAPTQSSETELPAAADQVFKLFFQGCAADPQCNATYPDLEGVFYTLVEKWNAQPIKDTGTDPFTGERYEVALDGLSLFGLLFQMLYSTDTIPQIPRAIYAAYEDVDYSLWIRFALRNAVEDEFFSLAMLYTVRCNEEVPFDTPEALAAADDAFPNLQGTFDMSTYTRMCAFWNAGAAPPEENQPVTSDIPTLILAGEYDPVTPPEDGQRAAATLSRSFFFEFPGLGHGVSVDHPCPTAITRAFWDDPLQAPDSSCIAEMRGPAFIVPQPYALEPFTEADMGIRGVIPQGWSRENDGVYVDASGNMAILQFLLPSSPPQVLAFLRQQFTLTRDFEPSGEHQSPERTWSLYHAEIQGQPLDLALAANGDQTITIILISEKLDRQALYEQVFLPALDALVVMQ